MIINNGNTQYRTVVKEVYHAEIRRVANGALRRTHSGYVAGLYWTSGFWFIDVLTQA